MGLFDPRGRPIATTVPAVDEVRLRNLVDVRCAAWRHEPTGIPRAPDLGFFRIQLGREPSDAERAVIARLWTEQRAHGRGGAVGVTTHDGEEKLDFVERWARRFGK